MPEYEDQERWRVGKTYFIFSLVGSGTFDAPRLVAATVCEILAVARAADVVIPDFEDPEVATAGARRADGGSFIVHCAGHHELGVATPVNQALFSLVKLLEQISE